MTFNFWWSFSKRKSGLLGLAILGTVAILALFAPLVVPYDPMALELDDRLYSPSRHHLFGTDNFGRDVFSRVLYGSRLTLVMCVSTASIATAVGVCLGLLSAYFSGFGLLCMRFVDALMAFPAIIMALALMAITGGANLSNVIIALAVVYTPRMARTTYALALQLSQMEYVISARAIGASNITILARHLFPNLLSPILIQATFFCAMAIHGAAALNFLGVGIPPQVPSWGGMVSGGRMYLTKAPWVMTFPGLAIVLLVLSLNLVGDALRDALDPRMKSLVGK